MSALKLSDVLEARFRLNQRSSTPDPSVSFRNRCCSRVADPLRSFSLQPILIQRFIINLRQLSVPSITDTTRRDLHSHSVNFRLPNRQTVIGNMGESLQFGGDEDDDEPIGTTEHGTIIGNGQEINGGTGSLHYA